MSQGVDSARVWKTSCGQDRRQKMRAPRWRRTAQWHAPVAHMGVKAVFVETSEQLSQQSARRQKAMVKPYATYSCLVKKHQKSVERMSQFKRESTLRKRFFGHKFCTHTLPFSDNETKKNKDTIHKMLLDSHLDLEWDLVQTREAYVRAKR